MSRAYLLLLAIVTTAPSLAAQELIPRVENGELRVRAPRLRFLTGEPLDRLMNGASVTYELELMIRGEASGRTLERNQQRFVVSYDLWEEKFAITKLGSSLRSVSHLSAAAAEVWLLNNVAVRTTMLTPDRPFWVRLEFRAAEPAESGQQT
ncbi:MAG: hypothetical protein HY646_02820, partial [Acidobacteria bacterium]|nr:hypothetical protein [Acidobacteriota bacterium]